MPILVLQNCISEPARLSVEQAAGETGYGAKPQVAA